MSANYKLSVVRRPVLNIPSSSDRIWNCRSSISISRVIFCYYKSHLYVVSPLWSASALSHTFRERRRRRRLRGPPSLVHLPRKPLSFSPSFFAASKQETGGLKEIEILHAQGLNQFSYIPFYLRFWASSVARTQWCFLAARLSCFSSLLSRRDDNKVISNLGERKQQEAKRITLF